jgi:very-short-patch-repair endonuclease
MKELAKKLRKNQTDAENALWYYLRGRRMTGCKFRRQHPVGPFIVDFVCLERNLIVEVDGGQHATQVDEDESRTTYLGSQGYRVLRFWNNEVLTEVENVLEVIYRALTPTLSQRERGNNKDGDS